MKYNKIYLGAVVMIMLIGNVIAMTTHETETYNQIDNFISKIRYAFAKGLFFFTSWGQANCCSEDPDNTVWSYGTERVDCDDGGCSYDKCAIDSWAERICLGGSCTQPSSPSQNNYEGEENGVGAYFRGDVSNQWYFSEIYCCPQSCGIEPEEHNTQAYKCEDGEWDYKGRYDYDEHCSHAGSGNDYKCWCADEDDKFYIDESGGVHCRTSASSSWCAPFEEHSYYTCYNDDIYWYDDNNNRNDKKEECEEGCVSGGDACNRPADEDPGCHTGELGSMSYCTSSCKCGEGGGDCDYIGMDNQCQSGLICVSNVGAKYGFSSTTDVCEKGTTPPPEKTCADMGGICKLTYNSDYEKDLGKYDCGFLKSCIIKIGDEPPGNGDVSKCQSGADTSKDNVVSRSELGSYINKWVNNQVTRNKLGQSINEWVGGGC